MPCNQWLRHSALAIIVIGLGLAPVGSTAMASSSVPELTIDRDGGVLRIGIDYAMPVREHALGANLEPLQDGGWQAHGNVRARLERGSIVAERDWRRMSLSVAPDVRRLDRVYGANLQLGTCGQLVRPGAFVAGEYALARFLGDNDEVLVSPLKTRAAAFSTGEAALRFAPNEMIYFGRSDCVRHGTGATWVYDRAQVPAALVTLVEQSLDKALLALPRRLATEPARRPVIALRYLAGEGQVSWRGDVDGKSMIIVQVSGPLDAISDDLFAQLEGFVVHEAFHLWNGATFRQPRDSARAWLTEGMAEYASLKLLREGGRLDDEVYFARLSTRLDRCLAGTASGVANAGIDALDADGGGLVYDCGTAIQWLADNALPEGTDIFSVWRDLFAAASTSSEYDTAGFMEVLRARVGDGRLALLEWLIDGGDAKTADELVTSLQALGIDAADAGGDGDNPEAVRRVLMHLFEQHCSRGPYGYSMEPDRLVLDTGDRCGPLNGDPPVSTIEGHRVGVQDGRIYAAVAMACGNSASIVLAHGDESVMASCAKPLPPIPVRLKVSNDRFPVATP